jgi:hypothetical protein
VSASLGFRCEQIANSLYSFDAWILKPIDFGRLDFLLEGIKTPELKRDAVYTPGHWERGGWFLL